VHRGQRRQVEPAADFFEAGSVTVLLDEVVQVVQDLALALCEREHWASSGLFCLETGEDYMRT
jgi:hypothetical protein